MRWYLKLWLKLVYVLIKYIIKYTNSVMNSTRAAQIHVRASIREKSITMLHLGHLSDPLNRSSPSSVAAPLCPALERLFTLLFAVLLCMMCAHVSVTASLMVATPTEQCTEPCFVTEASVKSVIVK